MRSTQSAQIVPGTKRKPRSSSDSEHRRARGAYLCGARDRVRLVAQAQLPHLVLSKCEHGARLWKKNDTQEGKSRCGFGTGCGTKGPHSSQSSSLAGKNAVDGLIPKVAERMAQAQAIYFTASPPGYAGPVPEALHAFPTGEAPTRLRGASF